MAFKFVFALAFVAVASAGYLPTAEVYHASPVAVAQKVVVNSEEYDPNPQYKFSYGVDDKLTGDSKSQVEDRDGDVVRGEYSLIDADGYKRTVTYTADDHNGFNAVVNREPLGHHVVKTVAPVLQYSAPPVVKTVAPAVHYTTPTLVKTPIGHYSAPTVVSPTQYTSYAAPHSGPVAHFAAPAQYTSYAAPSYNYHH